MLLFSLIFSFASHAVEIAVIDQARNEELLISFTEESLYAAIDKAWVTNRCKIRYTFTGSLKENFAPRACRAEAIKFILNTGYKPLDNSGRVFSR